MIRMDRWFKGKDPEEHLRKSRGRFVYRHMLQLPRYY